MEVRVSVPPNASAVVVLPGLDASDAPIDVGAGHHRWSYEVAPDVAAAWNDEGIAWAT